MDDVISEIKSFINNKTSKNSNDDFLLMNSLYEPIKIDSKNFHEIIKINKKMDDTAKMILFVDGGNSILFESANFCLGFIRIAGITYKNNQKIERKKKEFYIFITETNNRFNVKTFPETKFNNLFFNSDDQSLKIGNEKCEISKIVSIIRRFAELDFACELNYNKIDFIFLDGTLEARYGFELEYITKLISTKKACALSKTCSLTTKNGESMIKKLLDLSNTLEKVGEWYYYPALKNKNKKHPADIYFIKLNKNSEYVFRFEIQIDFAGNSENIEELFSTLTSNSNDAIFLGYPYGFVDVDAYARVSDEETRMLKTKFISKLGKEWNDFSKSLNSMNAHDVLDKIKF